MINKLSVSTLLKILLFVSVFFPTASFGTTPTAFEPGENHLGNSESILLADPEGKILYSQHADLEMIPASTLKVLTTLAAFHYLGKDYRFKTEFYRDTYQNLYIKGYGDPMLISEVLDEITQNLAPLLPHDMNDLIVDGSFFSPSLTIPGNSSSSRSYDAPIGALCVNFNTIHFRRQSGSGTYVSAEPQTPLLPLAINRIEKSGHQSGRIVFSHNQEEVILYAGQLFGYFLKKNGVVLHGQVRSGQVNGEKRFIMKYPSPFTIEQVSKELLEYSNNFIANQLLIAMGAKTYGPPGDLEKGVKALKSYAKELLGIERLTVFEGSGISRYNRISASTMLKILEAFKPHYELMRNEKNIFYKTGTLNGVNNIAGYIQDKNGHLYPVIILINRSGKSPMPILEMLKRRVN